MLLAESEIEVTGSREKWTVRSKVLARGRLEIMLVVRGSREVFELGTRMPRRIGLGIVFCGWGFFCVADFDTVGGELYFGDRKAGEDNVFEVDRLSGLAERIDWGLVL